MQDAILVNDIEIKNFTALHMWLWRLFWQAVFLWSHATEMILHTVSALCCVPEVLLDLQLCSDTDTSAGAGSAALSHWRHDRREADSCAG